MHFLFFLNLIFASPGYIKKLLNHGNRTTINESNTALHLLENQASKSPPHFLIFFTNASWVPVVEQCSMSMPALPFIKYHLWAHCCYASCDCGTNSSTGLVQAPTVIHPRCGYKLPWWLFTPEMVSGCGRQWLTLFSSSPCLASSSDLVPQVHHFCIFGSLISLDSLISQGSFKELLKFNTALWFLWTHYKLDFNRLTSSNSFTHIHIAPLIHP